MLVLELNQDGMLGDGGELFGDFTRLPNGMNDVKTRPLIFLGETGNDQWVGRAANDVLFNEMGSGILLRRVA